MTQTTEPPSARMATSVPRVVTDDERNAIETRRLLAWEALQQELPDEAVKHITEGPNKGLEDINDAYIHERLMKARLAGLEVYYEEPRLNNLGTTAVTFKRGTPDEYDVKEWVIECEWPIIIDGLRVVGVGAHQAADLGNARKGAKTSAFKDTLKYFGIALEVRKRGRSEDVRTSSPATRAAQVEVTERVRAAYREKGKEWPECPVHGDTVGMRKTKKGYVISCSGKGEDGRFCTHFKTVWDNQIPQYYKDLAETPASIEAATVDVDPDVDPDDVPF